MGINDLSYTKGIMGEVLKKKLEAVTKDKSTDNAIAVPGSETTQDQQQYVENDYENNRRCHDVKVSRKKIRANTPRQAEYDLYVFMPLTDPHTICAKYPLVQKGEYDKEKKILTRYITPDSVDGTFLTPEEYNRKYFYSNVWWGDKEYSLAKERHKIALPPQLSPVEGQDISHIQPDIDWNEDESKRVIEALVDKLFLRGASQYWGMNENVATGGPYSHAREIIREMYPEMHWDMIRKEEVNPPRPGTFNLKYIILSGAWVMATDPRGNAPSLFWTPISQEWKPLQKLSEEELEKIDEYFGEIS